MSNTKSTVEQHYGLLVDQLDQLAQIGVQTIDYHNSTNKIIIGVFNKETFDKSLFALALSKSEVEIQYVTKPLQVQSSGWGIIENNYIEGCLTDQSQNRSGGRLLGKTTWTFLDKQVYVHIASSNYPTFSITMTIPRSSYKQLNEIKKEETVSDLYTIGKDIMIKGYIHGLEKQFTLTLLSNSYIRMIAETSIWISIPFIGYEDYCDMDS